MIFYMATRYEGEGLEPDLQIIDYLPSNNNTSDPVHAKLSDLLVWHMQDPVDDWERNRNDIIYYDYQNNRNPFIDQPEFAELIWGDLSGGDSLNSTPKSLLKIIDYMGKTSRAVKNTPLIYIYSDGSTEKKYFSE